MAMKLVLLVMLVTASLFLSLSDATSDGSTFNLVLVDKKIPTECSGPGWVENPSSISVLPGSYIYFSCRNILDHNDTQWIINGLDMAVSLPTKVTFQNGGETMRYGPVDKSDDGMVVNCHVTTEFGVIPSPIGKVEVISAPSYSPSSQTAFVGHPYYFSFNYSGTPPTQYNWYKNGYALNPDSSGRIRTDHNGIVFSPVLQGDGGMYMAFSSNLAGSANAFASLRVVYWWSSGNTTQDATADSPHIPVSVAIAIAIDDQQALKHKQQHSVQVSTTDSTAYSNKVLKKLNSKATKDAMEDGKSREEIEQILQQVISLVGYPLVNIDMRDLELLMEASNCKATNRTFNCLDSKILLYRTINGTCNNLFFPLNGASHIPFARLLPAEYEDGLSQPKGVNQAKYGDPFAPIWPSPRLISWHLIKDTDTVIPGMNHMFMQWGQFLDHDLDLAPIFDDSSECGCNFTNECIPILVKHDDPVFGNSSSHFGECLPFTRSVPACQSCKDNLTPSIMRNQINQLTSFIDGSQIYGSTDYVARNLRSFTGGLLKEGAKTRSSKGNLPFQDDKPEDVADVTDVPFFEAGDERANEQIALTVMHTIWMREHNRIARTLAQINPCWDDEKLYQESRKIVGAMLQHITYYEFFPMLFGAYQEVYVPQYKKYNPYIDATVPNAFGAAAFRFGHSLIRPFLLLLDENFKDIGKLSLTEAFFNPIQYFRQNGTDPLLRGLLTSQSRTMDEFLTSVLTSQLFTESKDKIGMDLASLNIQRGRDHGLPPYRKWTEFCKLFYPGQNPEFANPASEQMLRDLYGELGFSTGIDLWVGGLSEALLTGAQVGPTFACILGLTFTRLRDGDRFWYENPYIFTPKKVKQIKRTSLSRVLCTNADNIPSIQQNAFSSTLPRVQCDSLPEVNLWQWWDESCVINSLANQGKKRRRRSTR